MNIDLFDIPKTIAKESVQDKNPSNLCNNLFEWLFITHKRIWNSGDINVKLKIPHTTRRRTTTHSAFSILET